MNWFPVHFLVLAQALPEDSSWDTYSFSRLQSFEEPALLWWSAAAVLGLLGAYSWFFYRRDSAELHPVLRTLMLSLRWVVFAALLVFFLGLEKRTAQTVVDPSRVVVLVDVSQSMALPADDQSGASQASRSEQTAAALAQSPLLDELRGGHQVHVVRFARSPEEIALLPHDEASGEAGPPSSSPAAAGESTEADAQAPAPPAAPAEQSPGAEEAQDSGTDWLDLLVPTGQETRVGSALENQLASHAQAPLAAIIVITDGANNGGVDPEFVADQAGEAGIPFFSVGIGSTRPVRNLAIADLVAPERAFPGDPMTITAYVQGHGHAGRLVEVQLTVRDSSQVEGEGTLAGSERVVLGPDGELTPVEFEFAPTEAGQSLFAARVQTGSDDANREDDFREAEVSVVDRTTKVLLVAGGPARDYRFLRNQLYRDPSMQVDVLLQSSGPGASQEADRILSDFPITRDELFEYDCIVAFDPDWTQLDASQVSLLETWIAEEAGGMLAIAGPVNTTRWLRSAEHVRLQALYPVEFTQRMTLLDDGHYRSQTAIPLVWERAGLQTPFLWLADRASESAGIWESFPGVYGLYGIRGPKPGATVYAAARIDGVSARGEPTAYLAGQYYGAGQVFYMGSAEGWRLRALDPAYFETLYTKLIRHVSQGRLLRGSSRGSLMVERDRYGLGETVVVRARLTDTQRNPLTIPSVSAQVVQPDRTVDVVNLLADPGRAGMYRGQFAALKAGAYRVIVSGFEAPGDALSKRIQVDVPDLETEHPERNEPLLASLAAKTGGRYYASLDAAIYGDSELEPLHRMIESRMETSLLRSAPDEEFARNQTHWLLGIIAAALGLEWVIRRLCRLA